MGGVRACAAPRRRSGRRTKKTSLSPRPASGHLLLHPTYLVQLLLHFQHFELGRHFDRLPFGVLFVLDARLDPFRVGARHARRRQHRVVVVVHGVAPAHALGGGHCCCGVGWCLGAQRRKNAAQRVSFATHALLFFFSSGGTATRARSLPPRRSAHTHTRKHTPACDLADAAPRFFSPRARFPNACLKNTGCPHSRRSPHPSACDPSAAA